MNKTSRRLALAAWVSAVTLAGTSVRAIEPIVKTGQVLFGSNQKTITSSTDVLIDTQTHVLSAGAGFKTNRITFIGDGTYLASTTTISSPAWGSITGTLTNQSDLQARFAGVGASTASLYIQIVGVGVTTGSLQTQINNLGSTYLTLSSATATYVQKNAFASSSSSGTLSASDWRMFQNLGGLQNPGTVTWVNNFGIQVSTLVVDSGASFSTNVGAVVFNNPDYIGPFRTGFYFAFNGSIYGGIGQTNSSWMDGSNRKIAERPIIFSPDGVDTMLISAGHGSIGGAVTGTQVAFSTWAVIGNMSVGSTPSTPPLNGLYVQGGIINGNLTASRFVMTDASKQLVSYDLLGGNNVFLGSQTILSPLGAAVTYGLKSGSFTITGLLGVGPLRGGPSAIVSTGPVALASEVSGILPVSNGGTGTATPNLVAGNNVSVTGTWPNQTIGVNGIGSALAVGTGTASAFVAITSPTAAASFNNAQFISLAVGSTNFLSLNTSSITAQGNSFNGANQLVKLSAGSQLPAIDGNLLTNLNYTSITGVSANRVPYSNAGGTALTSSANMTFDGFTLSVTTLNFTSNLSVSGTPLMYWNSGNGSFLFGPGFSQVNTGQSNTSHGYSALSRITSGNYNTCGGLQSCLVLSTGNYNTAWGAQSLQQTSSGSWNTSIGEAAGYNIHGDSNTAVGYAALQNLTWGSGVTAIGFSAGIHDLAGGSWNTYLGAFSDADSSKILFNSTAIGYGAVVKSSNTATVAADNLTVQAIHSPSVSSCGTGSPAITGSDIAGSITTGTGAPTSCGVVFSQPYTYAPYCVAQTTFTATSAVISSITTSSMTITTSAGLTSGTLTYHCIGRQ